MKKKRRKAGLWILGITIITVVLLAAFGHWPAAIITGSIGGTTAVFQWTDRLFK